MKNNIPSDSNSSTMAYQALKNKAVEASSCCQIGEINTGKNAVGFPFVSAGDTRLALLSCRKVKLTLKQQLKAINNNGENTPWRKP